MQFDILCAWCFDIDILVKIVTEETPSFCRTKRGRGAIGPRMDETGPYLPGHSGDEGPITSSDVSNRRVYGPERPASLKSYESSEEEEGRVKRAKRTKKSHSSSSDKERSKKHKSKENSRHKKKKEKRSKHRH